MRRDNILCVNGSVKASLCLAYIIVFTFEKCAKISGLKVGKCCASIFKCAKVHLIVNFFYVVCRICSIPVTGETIEINAAGSTPGTMLVASSRPGEIPIIVPSGKTIFLPDQFTAVLVSLKTLLMC